MEEMDDVKEYMETITEVKVTLAELNTKVDQIMDMRSELNETTKVANSANARSLENEKDIDEIKRNDSKKWAVIFTVLGTFVLQLIYFFMTYGIK
jgi:uncharacterized coiled-coil DUF342 family protein